MKYYLVNFGCKTNRYDAVSMSRPLASRGYVEVHSPEKADLIIVNTCTVTSRSDAKARASIRHLHRINPSASIVVSGCSVETQGERLRKLPGVDLAIGVDERFYLQYFLETTPDSRVKYIQPGQNMAGAKPNLWGEGIERFPGRSRAYLKIQDGCDNRCTYCVVPFVRGKSRSRAPDQIVKEAKGLLRAGHTELVLTGIHIGHYGRDLDGRMDLLAIVRMLLKETDVGMLRLGSLNPDEIEPDLLRLMASDERIARHLHIPLQSGSDRVLAMMGRSYRSAKLEEIVQKAREYTPDINIGSDVIVGFPTEGPFEFDETVKLIERIPVGYLHVFKYSDRTRTRASSMRKCSTSEEVSRRARVLKELGQVKKLDFHREMIGKNLRAVFERKSIDGGLLYRSSNYCKIYYYGDPESASPLDFKIEGLFSDGLSGRPSAMQ
ncbi:MAG: tRNA (N(6)-L-threonylcarbamoyladenosine(37)-C(2))-methylthiotransferase MtaB [Candidatus Glassbacteria bacterium]